MKTTSAPVDLLREALQHPDRDIVRLVDDLLRLCGEHCLHLDWRLADCRVRSNGGNSEDLIETPFRKSVFRGILARIAALCNEQTPNSVSPYGGAAELSTTGKSVPIKIKFVNTPAEQMLELWCADQAVS